MEKSPTKKRNYRRKDRTSGDESEEFMDVSSSSINSTGAKIIASMDHEEEDMEDTSENQNESASGSDTEDYSDSDEDEWESETEDETAADSDESDGQSEKCPVCLNRFKDQDVGTPESCDHDFCLLCIQEWSKNVNTCPVDRQVFHLILARHKVGGEIFKKIPVENKQMADDDEEDPTYCEVCGRCDREDRLLLCDGCDLGYHLDCLTPPLQEVPVSEWFCPDCATDNPEELAEVVSEDEDVIHHLRSENAPIQSILRPHRRQIARTRISERVRARISELRGARERRLRRPVVESSSESEASDVGEEEESMEQPSSCSPAKKTPVKRKKKTPKKRSAGKAARRRTKKGGKRRKGRKRRKGKRAKLPAGLKRPQSAFFLFMNEFRKMYTGSETGASVIASLAGEAWKELPNEQRQVYELKYAENKKEFDTQLENVQETRGARTKSLTPLSAKKRLAGRLGLSKPPPGRTIPNVKSGSGDKGMEAGIGVKPLSILGGNNDLNDINYDSEEGVSSAIKKRGKYSKSALRFSRPIGKAKSDVQIASPKASTSSGGTFDLLGSIMDGQNLLNMPTKDVTITRYGTIQARKPIEIKLKSSIGDSNQISPTKKADTKAEYDPLEPTSDHSDSEKGDDKSTLSAADDNKPKATKHTEPVEYNPDDPTSTADNTANNTEDEDEIKKAQELKVDIIETKETKEDATILDIVNDLNDSVSKSMPRRNSSKPNTPLVKKKVFDMFESDDVDKPKVLEDPAAKAIEDIVNMTRSFEESQNESSKEDDMSMVTDSTKNPKIPRVPGFANTFQSTDTPSKNVLDTTEPEKMETSTESAIDEPAVIDETASKVDDEQGSDDDAQDEPNTNDGENDESQSDSDLDVTELEKQKAALMAEIAGIQLSDIPLPDDMPGMEGEIDIPLPEGSAPSLSSSRRSSLSSVSSIEITAFIDRPPIPIVEVVDTGSPMLVHVESRSPSPTYSSSSSSSWSSSSWTSSSRSRSRSRRKRSYSRDRRSHRRSPDRMHRGSDRGRSHRDSEKTRSREDVEREKRHKRREHEAAKERERRSDRERGSDREDDRHRRDREQAEKAERNRKKAEEEKQRERNREKEERQRIRDHEEKSRERREERREREERIREERHRELSAEREKEVERRREKASRRDRSERSREERSLERGERSRDRGERSRERGERSRERGGRERSRERGDRSREERGERSRERAERSRERAERSRERGERSREERGDRSRDDRSREERSERSREMRGKERTERSRHFSEIEDGEVDLREVLKSRRRDAERERMERTEGREPESRKDRERREREYERIIEEEEKRYRKGKGRERESDSERSRDQERGREKRNRDGERESRSEKSDHSKESRRRSRSRNSSKSGRVSRSRERSLRHRNDLDTSRSDRDERSQNKEDSRGKENRSERGEKSKQSKHEEVERRENGRRENKGKKEDMEYTSEVARSRKDSERSQKDKSREKSAKDKLREYRDDSEGREIEWDTERETLLVKTIRGQVDSPRQKKSKKDTSVDGSKPKEKKDKSKKAAKGSLVGTGPIFEKVLKDTLADKLADPKSDDAKKQKRFKNKEDDLTGDPIDAPPKKKKKTQDGETLDSNGDPKTKKKKKKKDKTKKIKKTKEGATLPIPEELDHRRASDYSPNTPPGSPHVETPRIPGLDLTSRPMSPTKSESNQYASKTYDPFEPTYDDADSPQPKQTKVSSPIFVSNAARVPELESAKPRAENMFDEAAPPATDPASRSIGMGVPPVQFNINVPPPAIPPNPMLMNPMMLNGPPPPIFPQIGGHPPTAPWNNTPNVNNAPPSAVLPSQPSGGAPEPIHQDRPPLEPMQVPQASTARQSTPPKTSSNIVPGLSLYDDVPPPSKPTEETPKTPRKSVERSPKPQSDKISRTPGDKPRQEKITGSKTPVKQKSGPSIDVDISETQKALAQIEQISKLLTAQSQLSKLIQPAKQVLKAKSKQGQENKTIVKSSSKFAKTDSHKKPSVTPSKTRSQKNGGNDITFDVDAVSPSDNDDAQVSFTPPPEPLYQKSKKRPRTNNQDNHKRNSKPSSNKIQKGKITKPAKPAKLFMKKVNDDDIKKTLEKFNDPNNVPSSAVELTKQEKYLKKLNRQERVIEEVKMALKPVYAAKKIGKDEYKEILRKAVPKICHSKSGDINPVKIKILVDAYAEKYSKHRQAGKSTKSVAKV